MKLVKIGLAGIIAAAAFAVPVEAEAGNCRGPLCGGVRVLAGSDRPVEISTNWPVVYGPYELVFPGQKRGGFGSGFDVDAYHVPFGCRTWDNGVYKSPGWYKIRDYRTANLYIRCP